MTTTTTDTTTQDTGQEAPGAPEADQNPAGEGESQPDREAARYRLRLREVEAERDAIADQLTRYQRAEVERLAADHLSRASDVWLDGAEVPTLLDDQGNVDPHAVQAAARSVLDGRPQLGHQQADHGQGRRDTIDAGPSWSDVIRRG